jgi:hypothetical protein
MVSEENQNFMHWTLMGLNPELFALTKRLVETPVQEKKGASVSKEELSMMEMIKEYVLERQAI